MQFGFACPNRFDDFENQRFEGRKFEICFDAAQGLAYIVRQQVEVFFCLRIESPNCEITREQYNGHVHAIVQIVQVTVRTI